MNMQDLVTWIGAASGSASLVTLVYLSIQVRQNNLLMRAGGDKELLFAYRRKIYKELGYDERSKPMVRRALKDKKWKEQRGLCAICNKDLPTTYTVLDRFNAVDGYTAENTRLIHQECDVSFQQSKGYA